MYGKQTEIAIASLSRLAEVYDHDDGRLSCAEIAEIRGLQRPFVAKTLSALAQAGLVTASRGPGGGFRLGRDPSQITMYEVYRLFEREDTTDDCPFGGGRCGGDSPCALHARLVAIQEAMDLFLHETTFDVFRVAYGAKVAKGEATAAIKRRVRSSYRAPPPA